MRILILGATGFLGSNLIQLASENKNLTVFGTSRFQHENSNIMQVDVTNKQSIGSAIRKINPEVVIWSLMSFEEETQLIKLGLENLISEIESETKLIFLSTDAVFVEGIGGYKESSPISTLPKEAGLADYVNGKYIGENLILNNHPNHVILRVGPLYGNNGDQIIEKRTVQVIEKIKENQPFKAYTNVYRTFVNVNDLSSAIIELTKIKFNGILHAGPIHKESYYSFYKKRLEQLGWNNSFLSPIIISKEDRPYLSLDTSLNTQKAHQLLKTNFRTV
ncbi:NAD-dependent epimerase/dehydratase family protein [Psychrobacillus glaciei]|uniref:NAD-dependent epimerase/dehydratase family protein n=1 Tax=Psychrobacillus glaciei TaxID=2283160 RepID=A0A5J6SRJ3_9BACI|nr:sugar nucleotide-binding protein [Psychrobacillus glaciei]QFG00193.1 NAD-dependent epimerase/dehydratase family protein [Psychrobacillus glaciei]